jgi:8-oxo-dGTP pyrophosphatase MutT (NUDIX family)
MPGAPTCVRPASARCRAQARRALDALWRLALRAAYRGLLLWWWVARPRITGVHVAVWHEGRVLLVRNSYRRARGLPAGRLRRGEPLAEAAARELREEVAIALDPAALRYAGEWIARAFHVEDHGHVFECVLSAPPHPVVDRREVVDAGWESPGQALAGPLQPVARLYLEAALRRVEGEGGPGPEACGDPRGATGTPTAG